MENKRKALGRGLESFFNEDNNMDIDTFEKSIYENISKEEIVEIPLDQLRPNPYQPRQVFDDHSLEELAASIKENGVFQPIIVKKGLKGYDIVAGERRFRASKMVNLKTIPAIVRDFSDNQMMEIALLENLQRENLNAIEEAHAYQAMIQKLGITQEVMAKKLGKSRSYITNILGLLSLPEEVQQMITNRDITMGHARVLSKLEDNQKIIALAKEVIDKSISVHELEEMANNPNYGRKNKIVRVAPSNEYKYVEDLLRDKLDTKIKVTNHQIMISFDSVADLNRLLEILNIKE